MKLLSFNTNAKTRKSDEQSDYYTAILYMAPYTISGKNLCPMAETFQCHKACLYTAGRGSFNNVQQARIKKAKWYNEDRIGFLEQLEKDIAKHVRYCEKHGKKPAIRLNGTTDIQWERHGIMEKFPKVKFYDYTKLVHRFEKPLPANYELVFSASNASDLAREMTDKAKGLGASLAVVFREALPIMYKGLKVVNADAHDLVFKHIKDSGESQVILGLLAKGKAKQDTTGFVV